MPKTTTDRATYTFPTSTAAWAFYRSCDGSGLSAGYPSLRAPYTVQVLVASWVGREWADTWAKSHGGECTAYAFGKAVAS